MSEQGYDTKYPITGRSELGIKIVTVATYFEEKDEQMTVGYWIEEKIKSFYLVLNIRSIVCYIRRNYSSTLSVESLSLKLNGKKNGDLAFECQSYLIKFS